MFRSGKMSFTIIAMFAMLFAVSLTTLVLAGEKSVWTADKTLGEIELETTYTEVLQDGLVDQTLKLFLDEITPNTRIDILLNGHLIGRMRSDEDGSAEFSIRRMGVEADDEGRPIGALINEGDVITVRRNRLRMRATFVRK